VLRFPIKLRTDAAVSDRERTFVDIVGEGRKLAKAEGGHPTTSRFSRLSFAPDFMISGRTFEPFAGSFEIAAFKRG
jgi:hypothetical protein